jgi:hypothetical protein
MLRLMSQLGRSLALLFVLLIVSSSHCAAAQDNVQSEPTREQLQLKISIMEDYVRKLEAAMKETSSEVDPSLKKAYIDARKKEYEYLSAVMDVNIRSFNAQGTASAVVLFLVGLVVVAGTAFAGFQLWISVRVGGVQASNELELSASKVRVTSSVVGIIVLTLSLVFLYIYTKEVYHIRVIGAPEVTAPTKASE